MTRTMCKYCRFRRCLAAGMEITAVVPKVPKAVVDDIESPLSRVVLCRKAVFLNRFRVMSSVNNMTALSDRLSTLQQCTMAIRAEFLVLCEFFMTSGILNYTDGDNSATCKMLASQLLYTWQIFESAMCTIRSFGHHQRRLFFLNESYVDLEEGAIELFYRRDPSILDSNYAMRHGMEFYVSFIEMSQKIAKARLDDTEQSVLTLLLLVDRCRKIISDGDKFRFTSLINESLRDLHKHYEQQYADTALRLDQLVQLAQEIQRVSRIFEEHIVVLQLSGKQIFLSNPQPPQKVTPANPEQ
ncbi:hypothetical protein AAVH_14362 [Aphelenchoides avenae]|nr:hypothetical protein AAVH_14362 [Aphelenchus avenae]